MVFQHHPAEGPALLGRILQANGHDLRVIKLYDGQVIPSHLEQVEGFISMGGPMNVDQVDQYPWLEQEMQVLRVACLAGLPVVGVCLGAQLMATALGGKVTSMAEPEIGWHPLTLTRAGVTDPIHQDILQESMQFHVHGQEVSELPAGSVALASSPSCENQAFTVGRAGYAFQYHFEWDQQELSQILRDPWIASVGGSPEVIGGQINRHYDSYQRSGERLCGAMASHLFPMCEQ